ncbi:MAG: hypothetical protein Q7T56_06375 [Nocardioidaceae bacterium]|nr:hypothetical protein [Nocardioidaceae bacterium]
MLDVTRYHGTHAGHEIELVFDQRLAIVNRARLEVDGQPVDDTRVVYGTKELSASLPDGTDVVVRLHSGMVGEIDRPQLQTADGWTDLVQQ